MSIHRCFVFSADGPSVLLSTFDPTKMSLMVAVAVVFK
jgi:hypothetical protein